LSSKQNSPSSKFSTPCELLGGGCQDRKPPGGIVQKLGALTSPVEGVEKSLPLILQTMSTVKMMGMGGGNNIARKVSRFI